MTRCPGPRCPPALLNNLIPGLFILPYVVFSATAGQIADKVEKGRLARFVKLLEIGIMLVAGIGWMTHTLWLLIAAVVGMGVHSTLFGPVKYAYLPQHLKPEELVGGNGVIEMGTFVGILLGEVMGAVLAGHGAAGIALVAFGHAAAWPCWAWLPAGASRPRRRPRPSSSSAQLRRRIGAQPGVLAPEPHRVPVDAGQFLVLVLRRLVLSQFPLYAKDYLHGDHSVFVLLLTVFSLGIGAGSLLCEKLSGRKVEIGLVPFGAIGLSLFGIDLYFASLGYTNTATVDFIGCWRSRHAAHPGRPAAAGRVRRLLHRAAVRADPDPLRPRSTSRAPSPA
jgi:MFS family permease